VSTIVESNSGSEQQRKREQEQQQQAMTRSRLVAKLLAAGPDIREFMNDLLTVQAIVVNGTEAAGFLLEPGQDGVQLRNVAHIRPDNSDEETRRAALQAFTEIVGECLRQGKDGVIDVGSPSESIEPQFCLVTLLRDQNNIVAASCVITRCRDQERAQQRLETMRLVAGYFDLWLLKRANEQALQTTQRHQDVLQAAAAFANGDTFNNAAANLCNEIVTRTGASRVSLGWVKWRSVKLLAMSHTEQFDKKQELSVTIVKAMEECVDQGELVQYDPDPSGHTTNNITRAAMSLSRMENGNKIVSLPLRNKNEVVGVLTLEYPPSRELTPHLTTSLAVSAEVLAPQIHDRYENDRWIPVKIGKSIAHNTGYIIGPRHTLAKVIFASIVGLALFVTLYSPMYRVKAPFQFVPETRRIVSAPFEGRIDKVHVKPGDRVELGAPLITFDTRRLQDQREQKLLEKAAEEASAREKLNNEDPRDDAQAAQHVLKAQSLDREIALVQYDIEVATVRAPIAGTVLKGDLIEREQSMIKQGEQLMEIAPVGDSGKLLVELRVNERDIQMIRPDSVGTLATTSNPNDKRDFQISRVVPLGEAREAKNVFRLYAEVKEPDPSWQPGQEGEARIDWQNKPLIYHWTHRAWEWVRLKLWI
jgi:biotin carboxyl carrier protein